MRRRPTFARVLLAACIVVTACSDGEEPPSTSAVGGPGTTDRAPGTTRPPRTTAETATTPETTVVEVAPNADQVALDYTAGPGGTAAGDPVTIGYVNQEGGVPAYPEASVGLEAAIDQVNGRLGGVGGRPIAVRRCAVQTEEDGGTCAAEMLADEAVSVVVTGALTVGSGALLAGLREAKQVVVATPLTVADFTDPGAVAYTPGFPGLIQGLGAFIGRYLAPTPATVAVVVGASQATPTGVALLATPVLEAYGIEVVGVPVPDAGSTADYVAAFRAAGVADADVVLPLLDVRGCIATHDALRELDADVTVVTSDLCLGSRMTEHLAEAGVGGAVPDGWYYGGYGYSPGIAPEAGDPPGAFQVQSSLETISAHTRENGIDDVEPTGFAGATYGVVLTVAKLLNELGPDGITPEAVRAEARGFAGPMWGMAGPLACGTPFPRFPSLCGRAVGVQRYDDGGWVSIRDGYAGNPIDVPAELAAVGL